MATPSVPRLGFCLSSLALHIAVFAAAPSATPVPSRTESAVTNEIPVDVAVDPMPAPGRPPIGAQVARLNKIVPLLAPPSGAAAPSGHARLRVAAPEPAPESSFSPVAEETVPAPAHFAMTVSAGGSGRRGASGAAPASVAVNQRARSSIVLADLLPRFVAKSAFTFVTANSDDRDGGPWPETGVSSPARLSTPTRPQYPPQAIAEEVEADVVLSIVVGSTGAVTAAEVTKPAGFGFDETALRWIRGVRFVPALRNGMPVAVRMRWPVSFRLQ